MLSDECWSEIAPLAHRSAKLVPIECGGERRVIAFTNPGLGGKWAATNTLWAGMQILLPGETAPAHRHSPAAIRFIIQGQGAYTTVEYQRRAILLENRGFFRHSTVGLA